MNRYCQLDYWYWYETSTVRHEGIYSTENQLSKTPPLRCPGAIKTSNKLAAGKEGGYCTQGV